MNNFYCAAPWRGLHINPRGDVKTCCAGNPNMLGNLNEQTIEQILNSPKLFEIRASLAQGKPHEYCSNCVQSERFGANSERKWHNDVNTNFDYSTAGDRYHYPVIVDVRWNTTCNLSCNYCAPACSSKWASLMGVPFKSGARPYYDDVCNFIEQHHDHIHEVALVGGEPLLLPENDRLLDVIPKDAIVTLITNLNIDLQNNKIFKKLSARNKVGWSMSFDNIGDRLSYVRYGAEWQLIQENLLAVKHLMETQGHWGGVHSVYNIYNATRICEFRQAVHELGVSVLWQSLFHPTYLDPFLLGPRVAELATQEIENFYKLNIASPAEQQFLNSALTNYQTQSADPVLITQFKNHIADIETKYHTNKLGQFKTLWPELQGLLE